MHLSTLARRRTAGSPEHRNYHRNSGDHSYRGSHRSNLRTRNSLARRRCFLNIIEKVVYPCRFLSQVGTDALKFDNDVVISATVPKGAAFNR